MAGFSPLARAASAALAKKSVGNDGAPGAGPRGGGADGSAKGARTRPGAEAPVVTEDAAAAPETGNGLVADMAAFGAAPEGLAGRAAPLPGPPCSDASTVPGWGPPETSSGALDSEPSAASVDCRLRSLKVPWPDRAAPSPEAPRTGPGARPAPRDEENRTPSATPTFRLETPAAAPAAAEEEEAPPPKKSEGRPAGAAARALRFDCATEERRADKR